MTAVLIELKERNKIRRQYLFFFFFQKELKVMVHFVHNSSGGNISQATFLMS